MRRMASFSALLMPPFGLERRSLRLRHRQAEARIEAFVAGNCLTVLAQKRFEIGDGAFQSFVEVDRGTPAEQFFGEIDVRLPLLWIIFR